MPEKISVGIIGGGFGRRILLPVFLKHPALSVKWLATNHDLPVGSVPSTVKETSQWEELLNDSEVGVIAIATPHSLHAQQVKASLAAGKHVFCEKPLALNTSEAFELAKQCTEVGLVGVVNYNFRFIPSRALFQSLIENGVIGPLRSLQLSFFRDDFDRWPSGWYYDRKQGGGALLATGSHLIDAVRWLTQSEIKWVDSSISMEANIDVGFSVTMETDSSCLCSIDVSHRISGIGKHIIEAHGADGSLLLDAEGQVIFTRAEYTCRYYPTASHLTGFGENPWEGDPRLQPTARTVDLFVNHIVHSSVVLPIDFLIAAKNQAVIDAIWTSHLEQRRAVVEKLDLSKG